MVLKTVTSAKTKAVWEIEDLIAASFNIHESESFLFLHWTQEFVLKNSLKID